MARYKKRTNMQPGIPGLFDDLDGTFFPEADDFPVHPAIEKEARRTAKERETLFDSDDTFSPLEDLPGIDRLKFISFGSGSSGNCAYIGDDTSGFLIDAGVELDKITAELKRNAIDMRSVKGIVLTHDHSDHVRFAYTILRKYRHMQVYCTPRTLNGLLRHHAISNRIKDYHQAIYKEHPFKIGNFTVLAFEVMHDGTDNAGFFISNGGHHLVVATDLGCISERVDYYMRQANYLMIEANYDSAMLDAGPYPEYLKSRIRSDNGHLDNAVTARYLTEIYTPALRNVFLCHLSKDNNTPAKALEAVETALRSTGLTDIGDCSGSPYARMAPIQLMALPRFDATGLISLRLK